MSIRKTTGPRKDAPPAKPGSFGAEMVILLHELGHKVNPPGFRNDDLTVPNYVKVSEQNTQLVMDNCAKAIMASPMAGW
jgi:hypothetical protein